MQILSINRKNRKPVSTYVLSGFLIILILLVAACPMPDAPPAMFAPALMAGDGQLTASWAELAAIWNEVDKKDGKNAITAYNLRYGEFGSGNWTEITSGITGASHTITDLTNGVSYVVQVRAVNAGGGGTWSASSTARPIAPPVPTAAPGTMVAPTLYAGTERLIATWTAPTDNGGSPITGYELQYRTGGGAWTKISSGIAGTSHTITGLTNSSPYQVQVRAVNVVGAGTWSPFAIGRPQRTQTPAGTARFVSLSDAVNVIIASENLSISLTTVEPGTYAVDESGNITITPATTPGTVTIPTVNESTGIVTVTAGTTAGTYLVYGKTGSEDILFTEYLYVTESPTTNAELTTAVTTAIGDYTDTNDSGIWGNTADLNYIITTAVTNMSDIFAAQSEFNGDISGWDVSSVTDMSSMFIAATSFNGDISLWDVSSVTDMGSMFFSASAFNQNLEEWGEHWTLNANGKYTGSKTNMFQGSGVTATPSWY